MAKPWEGEGRVKTQRLALDRARSLRRASTGAERQLWKHLRGRQIAGVKFRRRVPIGPYIADFDCLEARLIIEVDGGQHATPGADAARTACLEFEGFHVLRVWNREVLTNIDGVIASIGHALSGRRN